MRPASPEPTTMMLYLRLLAGFTSFISKRAWSHGFSIGPRGHARVELHAHFTNPDSTATGIEMFPAAIRIATTAAPLRNIGV